MEKLINDFSFGLFFWQAIILFIVIFILGKFAWKPIINALEAREQGIADALAAADNAKRELENLKASNEKLLVEARAERDAMLKEARDMKEKMVAEAKAEAQETGAKMIAQAQATIVNEKNMAMEELKKQVSQMSVEIAEKLLQRELADRAAQESLAKQLVSDIKLN